MRGRSDRRRRILTVASVIAISVVAAFPALLTGALAVPIQAELDIGPGILGLSVAMFFAATSVLSRPMGALTSAIGTRRALLASAVTSSVALLGLATTRSPLQLAVALVLGGAANAIAHPAVNTALFRTVPRSRQGFAFGAKQSAIPVAGLLGGLAVPAIALTVGWRWAFVTAAAAALADGATAWVRSRGEAQPAAATKGERTAGADRPRVTPSLLAYAAAAGIGAAGANSIGVFLVDAGVNAAGFSEGVAAMLFAAANLSAVTVRTGAGLVIDRSPHNTRNIIRILLVAGAGGFFLLSLSRPVPFAIGALMAAGFGWGWTGAMHYIVVVENADRPEVATGALLTGFGLGSASGPTLLGQVAEHFSYAAVWRLAAGFCLTSAAVLLAAGYRARRTTPLAAAHGTRAGSGETPPP